MIEFPSFDDFYRAVHGHSPFPWQSALATRVRDGEWPDIIDVPTGLGKTSVIDIAVYELARQVGVAQRSAPTRTALIVDRRLVVDGAFAHATKIADALDSAIEGDPLWIVADRLRSLVAPSPLGHRPLDVVRMRGGVTWAARWLRSPSQPAVILGTVDQMGSRLLFRGYGTSDRMKPVDAALVGSDVLCLLDEAHLSSALAETISECQFHEGTAPDRVGRPLTIVKMSATLSSASEVVHGVSDDDLDSAAADRLTAAKYATMIDLGPKLAKSPGPALAKLAQSMLVGSPDAAIGVVVNTVALARQVFDELQRSNQPCALAIGRCRPIDRERSEGSWWPQTCVGRNRGDATGFVLVATQTIEVGVDLDLDGLITQAASVDALIQRFGRVDRLGSVGQTRSMIVRTPGLDPVYGEAAAHTWEALTSRCPPIVLDDPGSLATFDGLDSDVLDMGSLATRALLTEVDRPERLVASTPLSPLPTAATISWWRRTSPIPEPDEDIAAYLHGVGRWSPTVSVAWRAGLEADGVSVDADQVNELLSLIPPVAEELVEVAIGALRGLLNGVSVDSVDLDGIGFESAASKLGVMSTGWRWSGERWLSCDASAVRPGDVVVLPSSLGGHDRWGWTGALSAGVAPVVDVGGLGTSSGGSFRLRLVDDILTPLLGTNAAQAVLEVLAGGQELSEELRTQVVESLIAACDAGSLSDPTGYAPFVGRRLQQITAHSGPLRLVGIERPSALGDDAAVRVRVDLVDGGRKEAFAGISDDSDSLTSTGVGNEVTLANHLRSVGDRSGEHASRLGLPANLIAACRLAGRFHDLGKAEVRFQTLLRQGRRHVAEAFCGDAEAALAKSLQRLGRAAEQSISRRAGWPAGMRHEAISLNMVRSAPAEIFANVDRQLVEHLVASHHGYARPFFPPVLDRSPTHVEVTFDGIVFTAGSGRAHPALDHAVDFEQLNIRYGTWGLAMLEAIVRLADMAISEEGS